MQITPNGMWVDPGPLTPETLGSRSDYSISGGMIDGSLAEPCVSCGVLSDELYEGPLAEGALSEGVVPNGNVAPVVLPGGIAM